MRKDEREFERAMDAYYDHFQTSYPYAIGKGYPGKTDKENILIIRKCIESDTPVSFTPDYSNDRDY